MCHFCVHHGDGKRWYANASNYALDLQADLRRRGYMVGFIRRFETHRRLIHAGLNALRFVPEPAKSWISASCSTAAQANHFGQPVSIEACAEIFDIATNVTRLPCVCRGALQPGSDAESCCMVMTVTPHDTVLAEGFRDYAGGPRAEGFERLTKAQALAYLRRAEARGLCHTVWTFGTPFIAAICNCDLPSGCMAMKMQFVGGIRMMWKGEDVIRHADDRCTGCLRCVRQCPFGAIRSEARRLHVDRASCWGCGICRAVCSPGALSLEPRSASLDVAGVW